MTSFLIKMLKEMYSYSITIQVHLLLADGNSIACSCSSFPSLSMMTKKLAKICVLDSCNFCTSSNIYIFLVIYILLRCQICILTWKTIWTWTFYLIWLMFFFTLPLNIYKNPLWSSNCSILNAKLICFNRLLSIILKESAC